MSALYHYCATYTKGGVESTASGVMTTTDPISNVDEYEFTRQKLMEGLKADSDNFVMRSLSRLDA